MFLFIIQTFLKSWQPETNFPLVMMSSSLPDEGIVLVLLILLFCGARLIHGLQKADLLVLATAYKWFVLRGLFKNYAYRPSFS